MAEIIYTAKRSLIVGHSIDTEYTLSVGISEAKRRTIAPKSVRRAVAGQTETINQRVEFEWSIEFAPVRGAQLLEILEFLRSTCAAEVFTADLYDTGGDPLELYRVDSGFRQSMFMPLGSRETDWKRISITAREVP